MSDHRMSYMLTVGQPKEKDDLGPNEGLTDTLVLVSVLGEVGTDAPLSLQFHQLGPDGAEELDVRLAYNLATALLTRVENGSGELDPELVEAAVDALDNLQAPFRR